MLEYYRAHIDDYRYPAKITLSAVAFPVPTGADTFQREAVVLNADEAYEKLAQGQSPEDVAAAFSSDQAFVSSLGSFAYGEISPEFVEATRDISIGEYAKPVTKGDVVYVLRLDDREEGGLRKYDSVKMEIYQLITDQKTDARFKQWTKSLEQKAFIDIRL